MLNNISRLNTDLKYRYAFIALVMLLYQPLKNVLSGRVCHVYNFAEYSHENAQNIMSYKIFGLYVYI